MQMGLFISKLEKEVECAVVISSADQESFLSRLSRSANQTLGFRTYLGMDLEKL